MNSKSNDFMREDYRKEDFKARHIPIFGATGLIATTITILVSGHQVTEANIDSAIAIAGGIALLARFMRKSNGWRRYLGIVLYRIGCTLLGAVLAIFFIFFAT